MHNLANAAQKKAKEQGEAMKKKAKKEKKPAGAVPAVN